MAGEFGMLIVTQHLNNLNMGGMWAVDYSKLCYDRYGAANCWHHTGQAVAEGGREGLSNKGVISEWHSIVLPVRTNYSPPYSMPECDYD